MAKELSDKAYNTLLLLKRARFLMADYPNNVDDKTIIEVCREIIRVLINRSTKREGFF